jgi:hypothetical protein
MAKKKIKLPDGFTDLPDSMWEPEFAPNAETMAKFDADPFWPYDLQRACDQWLRIVLHPPARMKDDDYPEFDSLTEALQLWASRHNLGSGMELVDAQTAAYRAETKSEAVLRAQAFIQLIRNAAAVPRTTQPSEEVESAEEPKAIMNVKEAAKYLRISTRKLHQLTKAGVILRVPGVGRRVLYTLEGLAGWAEGNQVREGRKGMRRKRVQNHAIPSDFVRFFGST